MDFNLWNIVWSLCFGLLATLIVAGNLLTIWIFLKQSLRKRAHLLLISLSVADLLVGLLTVPLHIALNTALYFTQPYLLVVFQLTDISTGIPSIFTLAAISLERMYAIGWPFRHRTLNCRVYIFAIAIPWIMTAIFTSTSLLLYFSIITLEDFLYPLIFFLCTPLLLMCIAYGVIWRKQTEMVGNRNHVAREKRLAKTLFIITAASLLTWLPFQTWNLLANCGILGDFPQKNMIFNIIKFLQFSNSLVNVIIYPLRISEVKSAFLQMLHCWESPRNRRNAVVPMHQNNTGTAA